MKTNLIANRYELNKQTVYFITEVNSTVILFTLVKNVLWELRNTLGEIVSSNWNRWSIMDEIGATHNEDGVNSGVI